MIFFKRSKKGKNEAKDEIMHLLSKIKKPVDANFLTSKIKFHRATVFRALNQLTEDGKIRKLDFSEGKARYEVLIDDHHHFVCNECGYIEKIRDCTVGKIEQQLKNSGFMVKKHSLEFFGLCPKCVN